MEEVSLSITTEEKENVSAIFQAVKRHQSKLLSEESSWEIPVRSLGSHKRRKIKRCTSTRTYSQEMRLPFACVNQSALPELIQKPVTPAQCPLQKTNSPEISKAGNATLCAGPPVTVAEAPSRKRPAEFQLQKTQDTVGWHRKEDIPLPAPGETFPCEDDGNKTWTPLQKDAEWCIPDFAEDIISYMYKLEKTNALPANFLENSCIHPEMRAIVVNWLTRVQHYFNLEPETLHIAVALMDRILAASAIPVPALQLVSVTSLWISSKLQQGENIPRADRFLRLTGNSYSKKDLYTTEKYVLQELNFNLAVAEPMIFVNFYMIKMRLDDENVKHLCNYILDLLLIDAHYSEVLPSLKASAAIYCALVVLYGDASRYIFFSRKHNFHPKPQIQELVSNIRVVLTIAQDPKFPHTGALKKFSSSKYRNLSTDPKLRKNSLWKNSTDIW